MSQKRKRSELDFGHNRPKRIKYGPGRLTNAKVSALTKRWRRPEFESKLAPETQPCAAIRVQRQQPTRGPQLKESTLQHNSAVKRAKDVPRNRLHDFEMYKYEDHHPKLSEGRSTEAHSQYRYSPITTGQIRLLILQPGSFDDDLQGHLITVDIVSQKSTHSYNRQCTMPQYEALSYVWGDSAPKMNIMVSTMHAQTSNSDHFGTHTPRISRPWVQRQGRMSIRSNLYQALKSLRLLGQARTLWIDGICIDQHNIQERNHQVQIMSEIYSNAKNVCVWLGNDGPQLDSMGRPSHLMADVPMETIKDILKPEKYKSMLTDNAYMWKWASLIDLMNRPWFTRVWIIQEIALAKKATIHCGTHTMGWTQFEDAVALFSKSFDMLQPRFRAHLTEFGSEANHWMTHPDFDIGQVAATRMVNALSALRKNDDGSLERTKNLETLLSLFQHASCSDPRDRVYALLGLATDGASIPVDYKKSVFEVYKEVVQHSVRTTGSLDIICRPWAVGSTSGQSQSTNLPSWIVGWEDRVDSPRRSSSRSTSLRTATETFVGTGENVSYSASGLGRSRKAPVVDFPGTTIVGGRIHQSTWLLARGIAIGRITLCTEPMADRIIPKVCFEKLGGLCGHSSTGPGDTRVPDRLWRTLVADRGPDNGPCPPWYRRTAQYCLDNLLCNGHLNLDRAVYDMDTYGADFLKRVRSVVSNRVFFEAASSNYQQTKTVETLVGIGTHGTKEGDVLAVLYGCSVPVVLRPVHVPNQTGEYRLIGEAFVYGRMEGETLHTSYKAKTFKIV